MLRLPEFTLHRPTTAKDAVAIMAEHGRLARYVAGGTDLYPNMKRRVQQPLQVISLAKVEELHSVSGSPEQGLDLGAMVTLRHLETDPVVAESYPGLQHAAESISTPLLRNMGTIGGNLLLDTRCNYYDQSFEWREGVNFCMKCDGDTCWVAPSSPRCWAVQSSDSVPLLAAMGAEVTLLGPKGERRIPLPQLYQDDGIDYTTKAHEELLTAVHLPAVGAWRATYKKLRRRETFDFPVLGIGACLWFEGEVCSKAEIYIGGAGSWAMRATEACEMLEGKPLRDGDKTTHELLEAAALTAFKPTRAMDNTDHEASWRKKMAPIFVRRALEECVRGEVATTR